MLRHAHFDVKGGNPTFAAVAALFSALDQSGR
jgi:hypothetical protein